MNEESKKDIIKFLKEQGLVATGEIITDRHVSKSPGRKCHKCNQKIKYGNECYTHTFKIKNKQQRFQASFHINCTTKNKTT